MTFQHVLHTIIVV